MAENAAASRNWFRATGGNFAGSRLAEHAATTAMTPPVITDAILLMAFAQLLGVGQPIRREFPHRARRQQNAKRELHFSATRSHEPVVARMLSQHASLAGAVLSHVGSFGETG